MAQIQHFAFGIACFIQPAVPNSKEIQFAVTQ